MGSYRSRLDITADILKIVSRNAKKTQIMYQANLSYKLLTRYLEETLEAALINFEDKKRCYVLTSKGLKFLEKYKEYSRCNDRVEKQLNDVNAKKKALEALCSNI